MDMGLRTLFYVESHFIYFLKNFLYLLPSKNYDHQNVDTREIGTSVGFGKRVTGKLKWPLFS